MSQSLRLTEIFKSIQGESSRTGLPTVFVRLTGCPLRCVYCDTAYAFNGGKKFTLDAIFDEVAKLDAPYVCVTGGEPLAQPNCIPLLQQLCDKDYQVSIETSGALDISAIDKRVLIVMDLKTPSSQECDKNLLSNLDVLKPSDEIKFVIGDKADYEWARELIKKESLDTRFNVLLSPSWEEQSLEDLCEWMLNDKLAVRLQVQLHKVIWGEEKPGR